MTKPYTLHLGDCIEVMRGLPDNSVDAVVTDPPYELGFMGKSWDASGIANSVEMWREALRVLKPGGHLLAFSGSRTYHRMAVAIEDAGFEIRDSIPWIYGSGFPKSLNVSKAIDKAAGAEREVVGYDASRARPNRKYESGAIGTVGATGDGNICDRSDNGATITAPATDAARQWDGWGTALKPAHEPCCMARKPLIGTVAANVLAHGTGALNIDGCRVATGADDDIHAKNPNTKGGFGHAGASVYGESAGAPAYDPTAGRWPANIIHDGSAEVVALFPESSVTGARTAKSKAAEVGGTAWLMNNHQSTEYTDTGSAARFFYQVQPEDVCNASIAEEVSTQLSQVDGFAQNLAAIAALHAGKPLSSTIQLFMSEIATASKLAGAASTPMIQSIEQRCLRELQLISTPAATGSRANLADLLALTSTTTIIQSLLFIVGSAEAATLSIIGTILDHGVKACDPELRSRFKYCAKASRADRNEGLADPGPQFTRGTTLRDVENTATTGNTHPTVKPTDLMAYLVRLVTPPGGVVLDPFMGSGSTGKACMREGFRFIGIDMTAEYLPIATARIEHELAKVTAAAAAVVEAQRQADAAPLQLSLLA